MKRPHPIIIVYIYGLAAILIALICAVMADSADGSSPTSIQVDVEYLASQKMRGRLSASTEIKKAQAYILERCAKAGLKTHKQSVRTPKGVCQNVMAWREGTDPDQIVIVGAHLDHIGVRNREVYPGADDNASGSAMVLELAQRFATGPQPDMTILFQWYTGEELGFYGSKHYVKYPVLPEGNPSLRKHVFMLNLDMVGHLTRRMSIWTVDVPAVLDKLFPDYPFAKRITFRRSEGSDQVSFDDGGVPVVFLHTGTDFGTYHQPYDKPATLDYEGMDLICDYAYDMIGQIAGRTLPVPDPDFVIWELPPIPTQH